MGRSRKNFISVLETKKVSIFCAYDKDYSEFRAKIWQENLFEHLGFEKIKKCVFMNQIHSNKVEIYDANFNNFSCDGLITKEKNIALCVLSADCLPLILYHKKGFIAALHSGREGTFKNILKEALSQFKNLDLTLKNEDFILFILPSICQKNYKLSGTILNYTQKHFAPFLRDDKLDLKTLAKEQARTLGLKNINDLEICSFEDKNLFSYRRNQTKKRFVSVIYLKE
ncbi:multi-copper polyphenol oxidoreductase laccase [Campylobacter vulpis]|uniref:polyphenol oxidase family protein n=1 Tax=Campylobacter vulpis TaxID=1655500 RepID=UPI000C157C17|nr:polyphenol oxidase family protein [Campylobacter vulpis]MBS4274920.1 laccase [Campylobacter vulpis]MBS4306608.1 laccase [Campylobacter vulpis]MBS4422620.1 laccase [Campylobacter vulpis]PHY91876.1 laccase [Campylobacter vulpis]QNF77701.1 multi-copper polyphenol oxidoreductase laccase [Campylobacter vulpis]